MATLAIRVVLNTVHLEEGHSRGISILRRQHSRFRGAVSIASTRPAPRRKFYSPVTKPNIAAGLEGADWWAGLSPRGSLRLSGEGAEISA